MKDCPYQRIVRGGEVVQNGHIDTQAKFAQLVFGLDLNGKLVLDAGCNIGEMSRLALAAGAVVHGIDLEPSYIYSARKLNPGMSFTVCRAERASGKWDIILASAMLHYCQDLRAVLKQFARVGKLVACDVVLAEGSGDFALYRGLAIPSKATWESIAHDYFLRVQAVGRALSPDKSSRFVYNLVDPRPFFPHGLLLYGPGHSGKSTRAKDLAAGKGFEHLELDRIFIEWRINKEPGPMSVSDFVREIHRNKSSSGLVRQAEYFEFHLKFIERWLASRQGLDVVIEGFDLSYMLYRYRVENLLRSFGWDAIEATECFRV